jgi:hypothetical protein
MGEQIKADVSENLNKYNLIPFEQLSDKSKERLINVEKFIQYNKIKSKQLLNSIRNFAISKAAISNHADVGISRKTIYNDNILNEYIDKAIDSEEDYLNIKRVKKLEEQVKGFRDQYNKLLENIIDNNILKVTLNDINNQMKLLSETNYTLLVIIDEKDELINGLRSKIKSGNNVIVLKK